MYSFNRKLEPSSLICLQIPIVLWNYKAPLKVGESVICHRIRTRYINSYILKDKATFDKPLGILVNITLIRVILIQYLFKYYTI